MAATTSYPLAVSQRVPLPSPSLPQWPAWLLPSTEDVSWGWEHDPQPSSKPSSPGVQSQDSLSPTHPQTSGAMSAGSTTPELAATSSSQASSSSADEGESSSSRSQPALLIRSHSQGWARCFELHPDWPFPKLAAPDEVLVSNLAMGLNPVDWKSLAYRFGIERFPWVLGRDVCGIVESVGEGVQNVKVGDRVSCGASRSAHNSLDADNPAPGRSL